jgi:hypothetical protein
MPRSLTLASALALALLAFNVTLVAGRVLGSGRSAATPPAAATAAPAAAVSASGRMADLTLAAIGSPPALADARATHRRRSHARRVRRPIVLSVAPRRPRARTPAVPAAAPASPTPTAAPRYIPAPKPVSQRPGSPTPAPRLKPRPTPAPSQPPTSGEFDLTGEP